MGYKMRKQYRLPGFDYSKNGAYFITVVTHNREHLFGEIDKNEMRFSSIGKFLDDMILGLPDKLKTISVAEYQIMPNHFHMIVVIENSDKNVYENATGLRPLIKNSVSSFANHLKGKVTRWCNENNMPFKWQARFHDKIIRNDEEYKRIAGYIQNNVLNWENVGIY